MKKIILLLLPAFFCLTYTNAQTNANARDSLKILLQKEKRDTSRVMLLAELSRTYQFNSPDSAMLLVMEALSLSQRIGFVKGEAISLSRIGTVYRILGNLPKAMEVQLQALKLNEKINNLNGMSGNLSALGVINSVTEKQHQAIEYFLKSKKLSEQINNKMGLVINLGNLGRAYFELKLYDSAKVYAQQAFEVASKINDRLGKGNYFNLMGRIYSATGQKKLALEYYRLSIPYAKLDEDFQTLSATFLGMAKFFENEGQMDSTLFYANQAFKFSKGIGSATGVRDASNFLSSFFKNRENADSAYFYLEAATVAKDSLFSQIKTNQLQSLDFDEKQRQQEIALAEFKAKEERKHNLQFAAIAIGLITFIILFFTLSRSIIVKTRFIEFFGVLGLLAVFEFINLFIHPYLAHLTNDTPMLMLGVLIAIGALLIPFHHKLEKWITKIMVEKNKKIRLEAAEKTIAELTKTK